MQLHSVIKLVYNCHVMQKYRKIIRRIVATSAAAKSRLQDLHIRTSNHLIEPYIAVTIEERPHGLSPLTLDTAGSCAWATGLPTFVVSPMAMRFFPECHRPQQLIIRLLDLFPEAETILYFSLSLLFIQKQDLSSFRETETLVHARSDPSRMQLMEMVRYGIPFSSYFTSDLLIFSRRAHSDYFFHTRELQRQSEFSSARPEILLNHLARKGNLKTHCLGPVIPHAIDPLAPAPEGRYPMVKLVTLSNTWSMENTRIRQQLLPSDFAPKGGALDKKHLARPVSCSH